MMDIDKNIQRLVTELNAFPGVVTFSSCGGHPAPSIHSQRPEGEFEVSFNVYPLRGGWRSLELITSAVSECAEHDKLTLTVWFMGGGTSVCFELVGRYYAAPDLLAESLSTAREMFDDDLSTA